MDITIQHPWFKRALGPFYPSRLFDQFFGEGLFEYDLLPLLSSTISPYYRQSLFRTVLDSGISEVRPPVGGPGCAGGPAPERAVLRSRWRRPRGRRPLHPSSSRPTCRGSCASGEGSGEGPPPEPNRCLFLHQLMTHMWFVMHQPHPGSPKNNPTKASWMADAGRIPSGRPSSCPAGSQGGGRAARGPKGKASGLQPRAARRASGTRLVTGQHESHRPAGRPRAKTDPGPRVVEGLGLTYRLRTGLARADTHQSPPGATGA